MKKIILFLTDIVRFRKNPGYVIHTSSYIIMRRLDVYSAGLITKILKCIIAPRKYTSNDPISKDLREKGVVKLGRSDGEHLKKLISLSVYCRAKPEIRGTIGEVEKETSAILGRLEVEESDFLGSKEIAKFITESPFLDIAKKHYGREVVCVRASSWWSIPATTEKSRDGAAQKFHRDLDWLGELKFFVFSDAVTEQNGPFDFIMGSHRSRFDRFMLTDQRFEEDDVFRAYPKDRYLISTLCNAGEAYVVDTRGYHRGRPLKTGKRCVLCVEFSISKFGAECQYSPRPQLNPNWESYSIWRDAIIKDRAWAGLFG